MQDFVLIGSGNVAHHLGVALKNAGLRPLQVCGRTHAQSLGALLKCPFTTHARLINPNAALYIIAISDDSLPQFIQKCPQLNGLVLHTSGATDLSALQKFENHGVLYPLQTLKKGVETKFEDVPILIEANNPKNEDELLCLAQKLSKNAQKASSDQRLQLHLAAVFACNFTNHLWAIAYKLLQKQGMNLELLRPLMQQTLQNASSHDPAQVQTGPAIRNDQKIMEKHLKLLENETNYQEIYRLISKSIATN